MDDPYRQRIVPRQLTSYQANPGTIPGLNLQYIPGANVRLTDHQQRRRMNTMMDRYLTRKTFQHLTTADWKVMADFQAAWHTAMQDTEEYGVTQLSGLDHNEVYDHFVQNERHYNPHDLMGRTEPTGPTAPPETSRAITKQSPATPLAYRNVAETPVHRPYTNQRQSGPDYERYNPWTTNTTTSTTTTATTTSATRTTCTTANSATRPRTATYFVPTRTRPTPTPQPDPDRGNGNHTDDNPTSTPPSSISRDPNPRDTSVDPRTPPSRPYTSMCNTTTIHDGGAEYSADSAAPSDDDTPVHRQCSATTIHDGGAEYSADSAAPSDDDIPVHRQCSAATTYDRSAEYSADSAPPTGDCSSVNRQCGAATADDCSAEYSADSAAPATDEPGIPSEIQQLTTSLREMGQNIAQSSHQNINHLTQATADQARILGHEIQEMVDTTLSDQHQRHLDSTKRVEQYIDAINDQYLGDTQRQGRRIDQVASLIDATEKSLEERLERVQLDIQAHAQNVARVHRESQRRADTRPDTPTQKAPPVANYVPQRQPQSTVQTRPDPKHSTKTNPTPDRATETATRQAINQPPPPGGQIRNTPPEGHQEKTGAILSANPTGNAEATLPLTGKDLWQATERVRKMTGTFTPKETAYDGTKGKHHEEFASFAKRFEYMANYYQIPQANWAHMFATCLTTSAHDEYLAMSQEQQDDFSQTIEHLSKIYPAPTRNEWTYRTQWDALRQAPNEPLREFIARIESLAHKAHTSRNAQGLEYEKIMKFRYGMASSSLRYDMAAVMADTLQELGSRAIAIQMSRDADPATMRVGTTEMSEVARDLGTVPTGMIRTAQLEPQPMQMVEVTRLPYAYPHTMPPATTCVTYVPASSFTAPATPPPPQNNLHENFPKKRQGDYQRGMDLALVQCYNCGERGHLANKCPQPDKRLRPGYRSGNRGRGSRGGNRANSYTDSRQSSDAPTPPMSTPERQNAPPTEQSSATQDPIAMQYRAHEVSTNADHDLSTDDAGFDLLMSGGSRGAMIRFAGADLMSSQSKTLPTLTTEEEKEQSKKLSAKQEKVAPAPATLLEVPKPLGAAAVHGPNPSVVDLRNPTTYSGDDPRRNNYGDYDEHISAFVSSSQGQDLRPRYRFETNSSGHRRSDPSERDVDNDRKPAVDTMEAGESNLQDPLGRLQAFTQEQSQALPPETATTDKPVSRSEKRDSSDDSNQATHEVTWGDVKGRAVAALKGRGSENLWAASLGTEDHRDGKKAGSPTAKEEAFEEHERVREARFAEIAAKYSLRKTAKEESPSPDTYSGLDEPHSAERPSEAEEREADDSKEDLDRNVREPSVNRILRSLSLGHGLPGLPRAAESEFSLDGDQKPTASIQQRSQELPEKVQQKRHELWNDDPSSDKKERTVLIERGRCAAGFPSHKESSNSQRNERSAKAERNEDGTEKRRSPPPRREKPDRTDPDRHRWSGRSEPERRDAATVQAESKGASRNSNSHPEKTSCAEEKRPRANSRDKPASKEEKPKPGTSRRDEKSGEAPRKIEKERKLAKKRSPIVEKSSKGFDEELRAALRADLEKVVATRAENRKTLAVLMEEMEKLESLASDLKRRPHRHSKGMEGAKEILTKNAALMRDMADRLKLIRDSEPVLMDEESNLRQRLAKVEGIVAAPDPSTEAIQATLKKSRPKSKEKSPVREPVVRYFDAGSHWCELRKASFGTALDTLMHLQGQKHKDKMDPYNRPWTKSLQTDEFDTVAGKVLPAKGREFVMPCDAFLGGICSAFSGYAVCAEAHLKSKEHNAKYEECVKVNPSYAQKLNLQKAASLAAKAKSTSIESKEKSVESKAKSVESKQEKGEKKATKKEVKAEKKEKPSDHGRKERPHSSRSGGVSAPRPVPGAPSTTASHGHSKGPGANANDSAPSPTSFASYIFLSSLPLPKGARSHTSSSAGTTPTQAAGRESDTSFLRTPLSFAAGHLTGGPKRLDRFLFVPSNHFYAQSMSTAQNDANKQKRKRSWTKAQVDEIEKTHVATKDGKYEGRTTPSSPYAPVSPSSGLVPQPLPSGARGNVKVDGMTNFAPREKIKSSPSMAQHLQTRLQSIANMAPVRPTTISEPDIDATIPQRKQNSHNENKLRIRWYDFEPIRLNPSITLPEMKIERKQHEYCNGTYRYADTNNHYMIGEFSCLVGKIVLKRQIGYHLVQTFVPTSLIVVISWVSFFIEPGAVPARISLSFTTLLTLSTMAAGVRTALPAVAYAKAIDVWMAACMIFVFLALAEFAIVNSFVRRANRLEELEALSDKRTSFVMRKLAGLDSKQLDRLGFKGNEDEEPMQKNPERNGLLRKAILDKRDSCNRTAMKIDHASRFLFPLPFLIFNLAYWTYYV